ncbi:hypothetical protein PCCS19_49840 [Paenibacillus sp. CCS19]|uniref:hypothetical protein n=1 Tax=Paenibacillus sp. CCS19 TaxID=3158387 RepID=UPI0025678A58|nr:hypothetical protein [Paenibacillus cellulosilyticus]GMK41925.1 hypothetical protein PCCS19_49840 [Paenibacillus cellulosilyticus]
MFAIPAARSRVWYKLIIPLTSIITAAMLLLIRFVLFGQPFSFTILLRFTLLAVVLCAIAGIAGWFGARLMWLFTMLGTLIGLIWMASMSTTDTGWEDLASLLAFVQCVLLGLIIGPLAELAVFLFKRFTGRKNGL